MTTAVAVGTPLAEALGNVIQPKLVEMGWSSDGGDDSALTEYVILMLVNGKTQEQIAGELSNDLLGLGEGDTQALDFSRWLFEQVDTLNQQINGVGAAPSNESAQAFPAAEHEMGGQQPSGFDQNMDMSDAGGVTNETMWVSSLDKHHWNTGVNRYIISPTGPKAMRNGRPGGRGGRLLNQINRNMDRAADPLHRIRGQQGSGRIGSYGRDHMKGPRFHQNGGRMHGRQMGGMGMQNNPMMNMNPQDQMQFMSLLEEQARMMAQFMPGFMPPAINPAFQQNGPQQGRSLFDRVEHRHQTFGNRPQRKHDNADINMDMQPDQAREGEQQDTTCHFNLKCTRNECPYAHQSPAAPEGTPIDTSDHCSFGAACKNRKCTARHPSPAVKMAHQAEELCKFFPNCANPNCSFKHPSMPLCRNGADCATTGCQFTHLPIPCKFNPCMNPSCPYKHVEGQRGAFGDKVWTADSQQKPHVSERKFVVDEDEGEELIKPDASNNEGSSQEIVT